MGLQTDGLSFTKFLAGFLHFCQQLWRDCCLVVILYRYNGIDLFSATYEHMLACIYSVERCSHVLSEVAYCQLGHCMMCFDFGCKDNCFFFNYQTFTHIYANTHSSAKKM